MDRLRLAFRGDLTLADLAERIAAAHGRRVVVATPTGGSWSAADIGATVETWAAGIADRIRPGDRVVIRLPNGIEFFLACLAVCRAGGIAVPVNDKMRPAEIDHVVRDSGATLTLDDLAALTARGRQKGSAPTVLMQADDVAAIFYTSGTTGLPKGARLTHKGLLAGLRRSAALPTGLRNDEAVFALPIAHIMGFAGLLGLLVAGVRAYVMPKFNPVDVLDAIESRRSSLFIGVPTMFRMLQEAGAEHRNLKSIRVWMSGADAMPPELARTFQKMGASATLPFLGGVGEALFVEGYGMVELAGGVAFKVTPPYAGGLLSRPIGIPLPSNEMRVVGDDGAEVRIGDVGDLEVRGPGVLRGYHGNEQATAEAVTKDGWLRTGDLARRGMLGTVEFAGRAKDVIKVGGYSVFAAEVQAVLERCDGVAEASVVGLDDVRLGQVPAAALRREAGSVIDVDAVAAYAADNLAPYKVPTRWLVVDELPRTGTEKVQRAEVRALFH